MNANGDAASKPTIYYFVRMEIRETDSGRFPEPVDSIFIDEHYTSFPELPVMPFVVQSLHPYGKAAGCIYKILSTTPD